MFAVSLSGECREHVLRVGYRPQVGRIDAASHPARMVDFEPRGDGAARVYVDEAMRKERAISPVAASHRRPHPQQAPALRDRLTFGSQTGQFWSLCRFVDRAVP